MKPGIKSTEFWLSLIGTIAGPLIALLVAMGILSPDVDVEAVTPALQSAIEQIIIVIGLLTGSVSAAVYAKNRSQVKVAEINNPTKTTTVGAVSLTEPAT